MREPDITEGDKVRVRDAYTGTVEFVSPAGIVGVMTSVGPVAASGFKEEMIEDVEIVDE